MYWVLVECNVWRLLVWTMKFEGQIVAVRLLENQLHVNKIYREQSSKKHPSQEEFNTREKKNRQQGETIPLELLLGEKYKSEDELREAVSNATWYENLKRFTKIKSFLEPEQRVPELLGKHQLLVNCVHRLQPKKSNMHLASDAADTGKSKAWIEIKF